MKPRRRESKLKRSVDVRRQFAIERGNDLLRNQQREVTRLAVDQLSGDGDALVLQRARLRDARADVYLGGVFRTGGIEGPGEEVAVLGCAVKVLQPPGVGDGRRALEPRRQIHRARRPWPRWRWADRATAQG